MQSTTSRTQELAADVVGLADSVMAFLGFAQKSSGEDFFRMVGELELSLSQLKLLMVLSRDGEQPLKDLAEHLVLSLPAASRAVDGLHRRDMVVRREDDEDRRQKQIAITETGEAVVASLSAARLAGIETFIATLTTQEQENLARALAPIVSREEVAACIPKRTTR
jgi:DNA-binding MarR family transcriptional regulator